MPCAAARRLRAHLGRRGGFLLILGVGKIAYGIGFIAAPAAAPVGLSLLLDIAPLHCWAWVWIVAGAATVASAWLKVGRDWLGFAAALLPPGVWLVAYAAGAVQGYERGWFVAVWFLTSHIGVIMWASSVPEYSVPPAARKGGAR